jgi:hypothetical protein
VWKCGIAQSLGTKTLRRRKRKVKRNGEKDQQRWGEEKVSARRGLGEDEAVEERKFRPRVFAVFEFCTFCSPGSISSRVSLSLTLNSRGMASE